jgi:hypothetical protein
VNAKWKNTKDMQDVSMRRSPYIWLQPKQSKTKNKSKWNETKEPKGWNTAVRVHAPIPETLQMQKWSAMCWDWNQNVVWKMAMMDIGTRK